MAVDNDKNQAVIEYLIQCPEVASNPLFFNFASSDADNNQIYTYGDDVSLNKPYIDGSVLKRYTFSIFTYKSASYTQVVKIPGYDNENVQNLATVRAISDWVTEQEELRHYPDFGANCIVDRIEVLTNQPALVKGSPTTQEVLTQYQTDIRIEYLDITNKIM